MDCQGCSELQSAESEIDRLRYELEHPPQEPGALDEITRLKAELEETRKARNRLDSARREVTDELVVMKMNHDELKAELTEAREENASARGYARDMEKAQDQANQRADRYMALAKRLAACLDYDSDYDCECCSLDSCSDCEYILAARQAITPDGESK